MTARTDLLPATLDALILKAVSAGRLGSDWWPAMTAALNTTPQEN